MMMALSPRLGIAALAVFVGVGSASAQPIEALVKAKSLYAEASYDDALRVLGATQVAEAHEYRALCFLALGRVPDAEKALEALITLSPEYTISDTDSPPRLVSLYAQTRRRVLPPVIRSLFAEARNDFQAKQLDRAQGKFERVLALTRDPAAAGAPDLKDLQLLTAGYLEIVKNAPASSPTPATTTRAASTAPPPVTPAPVAFPSASRTAPAAATTPAAASPAPAAPSPAPAVKTTTVVPATTIRQTMPPYTAPTGAEAKSFTGAIRIVIGVDGKVKNARMEQSVEPRYDIRLLAAAKSWSYKPATLNGEPVESEKLVSITVGVQ